MNDKKDSRLRRARKARMKMHELEAVRLCVYRSSQLLCEYFADGSQVWHCLTLESCVKSAKV